MVVRNVVDFVSIEDIASAGVWPCRSCAAVQEPRRTGEHGRSISFCIGSVESSISFCIGCGV